MSASLAAEMSKLTILASLIRIFIHRRAKKKIFPIHSIHKLLATLIHTKGKSDANPLAHLSNANVHTGINIRICVKKLLGSSINPETISSHALDDKAFDSVCKPVL